MNLLHGVSRLFHRRQRLAVDVGGLDGVYLLLEGRDVLLRLVERCFKSLLPLQRLLRRCSVPSR
jgi:hypothetical protein